MDLLFGVIIGWPLVIVLVIALRNPATRLAQRADLPLPARLRRKLNRFLRVRRAVYVVTLLAVSQAVLLALSLASADRRAGHVAELALLPAVVWLPCMLASLWPRWKSNGQVHLAHLRRLGVSDTLTYPEWAAVTAAYFAGGALIAWALARAWRSGPRRPLSSWRPRLC